MKICGIEFAQLPLMPIAAIHQHKTLGGGTMRKQMVCELLLILAFSGCTTTDTNYADRNNVDTARARCVQLARTSGYEDIKTEAINRDGQAEWKVDANDGA